MSVPSTYLYLRYIQGLWCYRGTTTLYQPIRGLTASGIPRWLLHDSRRRIYCYASGGMIPWADIDHALDIQLTWCINAIQSA